jgi:putative DNA methylase
MLTWGAFNIIGASKERRAEIEAAQKRVAEAVDAEITRLGIEHDAQGNRAKAYLYCLETRCPKTGWMVPMAPSWVVSTTHTAAVRLVPDHQNRRYDIEIVSHLSAEEMASASVGTVQAGRLVHPMNPERSGVEIKTIRGDYRDTEGVTRNRLRLWEKHDFKPRPDDIFQERLYCIQWITKESLGKGRQETFFAGVTADDLAREAKVEAIVAKDLAAWQEAGLVPDMSIEPGEETTRLFRERGWTHWHHLFGPRDILRLSSLMRATKQDAALYIEFCSTIDFFSKLTQWILRFSGQGGSEFTSHVFSNQALNPFLNWGNRAWAAVEYSGSYKHFPLRRTAKIETLPAAGIEDFSDIYVTDPPYADAVNYHEITEFFIAWLRKNPPPPFDQWTWDSRRDLAIKGKDEQFRRDMVAAYAAMTRHMPDNGLQVVMFTHQDAGVWADLGAILWAAGLCVTAAWNVVTETESALKAGNYVQGTVNLVLRKRIGEANARRMEIEAEIEEAVAAQIDRLTALDDSWHARSNAETLYTDGDLTLAAYAAALQVVTAYSTIDRQPLDRDLYRKLAKGERTMLRDLIDYAASVANRRLVPEGFDKGMWTDLTAAERFYVRMLDMEAKGNTKVADFQNFAKSFAYGDYAEVMASTAANAAALAGSADLKGRMLDGEGFAATQLRQVLFAIWRTLEGGVPDLSGVRPRDLCHPRRAMPRPALRLQAAKFGMRSLRRGPYSRRLPLRRRQSLQLPRLYGVKGRLKE